VTSCVQASSAACERMLSIAGIIQNAKRKSMSAREVFTTKICDTGLGGVVGQKGIKTHNCKKVCSLLIIKNKETLYLGAVLS